jgi:hypothetical protein
MARRASISTLSKPKKRNPETRTNISTCKTKKSGFNFARRERPAKENAMKRRFRIMRTLPTVRVHIEADPGDEEAVDLVNRLPGWVYGWSQRAWEYGPFNAFADALREATNAEGRRRRRWRALHAELDGVCMIIRRHGMHDFPSASFMETSQSEERDPSTAFIVLQKAAALRALERLLVTRKTTSAALLRETLAPPPHPATLQADLGPFCATLYERRGAFRLVAERTLTIRKQENGAAVFELEGRELLDQVRDILAGALETLEAPDIWRDLVVGYLNVHPFDTVSTDQVVACVRELAEDHPATLPEAWLETVMHALGWMRTHGAGNGGEWQRPRSVFAEPAPPGGAAGPELFL